MSWRSLQESRVSERTWEYCTPRLLWSPEHEMHRKMPLLIEAQCGDTLPEKRSLEIVKRQSKLTAVETFGVLSLTLHELLED